MSFKKSALTASQLMLFSVCFLSLTATSKPESKAKDTEVWEPVPPVVHVDRNGVPSDAIILFSKDHLDAWHHTKTKGPVKWRVEHDVFTVEPKTGGISTNERFCDIQLHLEWRSPPLIVGEANRKKRGGNSGIYFQGLYEVQIFDSYNYKIYPNGQASAVYKQHIPLVNTSKPAGHWQSYDIIYFAPKFSKIGDLESPARLTVFHNGVLTQNNVTLQGPTSHIGKPAYKPHGCLPIFLQNHGDEVSFRNVWVRKL